MLLMNESASGFSILLDGRELLRHSQDAPALFIGRGRETIKMHRGNFEIADKVSERIALRDASCERQNGLMIITFRHPELSEPYILELREENGLLRVSGGTGDGSFDRLWLRIPAEPGEHVMGGGEQFSSLDLRGRRYPIWTREQGVGRNKKTEITFLADASDGGGGDYHTTFFPQPTFVSSRLYFAHLENYDYSELDFSEPGYHEVAVWNTSVSFVFGTGEDYPTVLRKLTGLLGRQPELPRWALRGIWLGVQGGTDTVTELLEKCRAGGMDIPAIWIQDWEGKRVTSFGKRLQWDWRWNSDLYPGLDKLIADPAANDTRWLGYINPYLVEGGLLFDQAKIHGYFVKNIKGEDYLFDFGEFNCGVVDLTMPEAFEWYKNIIKENLIGMGFKGWMADFGEYLPADCVCHSGESARMLHNKWPVLWARCNYEAVREAGELGKTVFFMRSGAAGSQKYAPLIWAGDQNVDWSADDGLPSVITAALSLGMSGYGLHTCDAGGYTTLFSLKRTRELLLRWLEFACFTPVVRTHEGNRPDKNVQLYSDGEIIAAAARISHIHTALVPYLAECVRINAECGTPVMRPLFFAAPDCEKAYDTSLYEYLLGEDVLVAPVVEEAAKSRRLWLPAGEWVHLWSGAEYGGGDAEAAAPPGEPPVFYRPSSKFAPLFREMALKYRPV